MFAYMRELPTTDLLARKGCPTLAAVSYLHGRKVSYSYMYEGRGPTLQYSLQMRTACIIQDVDSYLTTISQMTACSCFQLRNTYIMFYVATFPLVVEKLKLYRPYICEHIRSYVYERTRYSQAHSKLMFGCIVYCITIHYLDLIHYCNPGKLIVDVQNTRMICSLIMKFLGR